MGWRFLFNPELCLGCRSCEIACRNEFAAQEGAQRRWLKAASDNFGAHYSLSLSCNHCENPECVRVCPEGTYRKRKDGIVLHDPRRCSGCGKCAHACPFHAPKYSLSSGRVDKCNLCFHRLDKGMPAVCVEACPVNALGHLFPTEPDPVESRVTVPGFADVLITKPSIRFIANLSK